MGKRRRRPYPPEFRREAVQLVRTGVPIPKFSEDLAGRTASSRWSGRFW
jgi:transposase-like protein